MKTKSGIGVTSGSGCRRLLARACHLRASLLLFVVLFTGLGCRSAGRDTSGITLTLLDQSWADKGTQRHLNEELGLFTKQTGIRVQVLPAPEGAVEQLATWRKLLESGAEVPDVYAIDVIWPGILADNLLDPRAYVSAEEIAAYFPKLIANYTVNGELVALPYNMSMGMLFYRTDLLRKQREMVNVNEVIKEIVALLRNEAARHGISIRSELAADIPYARGDRVQLQQVLMNLLINGIDAMKGIDGMREITISSRRDDDELLVSVSDTGVGLPPDVNQIFDAFFTTKSHGTGMGLAISRTIIESHGGHLSATSNAGRGATFYFTLPAARGVPA